MYSIIMLIFMLIMFIYFTPMHPMKMTLTLITYSLFLLNNMNSVSSTPLYSYMMFLIMIGGVMILMLYFTSLMTFKNMKKITNMNLFNLNLFFIFLLLSSFYTIMSMNNPDFKEIFSNNCEIIYEHINMNMNCEEWELSSNLKMLYSIDMIPMTLLSMTVLLLVLYFIGKLCMKLGKPLRLKKKINYE